MNDQHRHHLGQLIQVVRRGMALLGQLRVVDAGEASRPTLGMQHALQNPSANSGYGYEQGFVPGTAFAP